MMIRVSCTKGMALALWGGVAALSISSAHAALSSTAIAKLCTNAAGSQECGRLIETVVIDRLPDGLTNTLIHRDEDTLTITLLPVSNETGSTLRTLTFTDKEDPGSRIAYAVWDYLPTPGAVVLFVSKDVDSHFLWVGRKSGKTVKLPAEPVMAPDNKQVATADFCADHCTNEIAVWQINGDRPTIKQRWSPKDSWIDAGVTWVSTSALNISYQKKGASGFSQLTRRLTDKDWRRVKPK